MNKGSDSLRQIATLEVWIDDKVDDADLCAIDVIDNAKAHEWCLDGTVHLRVVKPHSENFI